MLGSVRFGLFEFSKKQMAAAQGTSPGSLSLQAKGLCALFAGFWDSFLVVKDL